MKKIVYEYPHSSFLSVEKDLSIITDMVMRNKSLQKYLFHTNRDPLKERDLTDEEVQNLFGREIKIVPKIYIDENVQNYIIIGFNTFAPTSNPEFRDNTISFDIICHYDQWSLRDFQLRPYRIAAELDSMFNKKHLTGIGELEFAGANIITYSDEFAGLCLLYNSVHGEEDKKHMPNPIDEEIFLKNFNEMMNQ